MGGFWKVWKIPYFFIEGFPKFSILMCLPLSHNNISTSLDDCNSVWVKKLSVPLSHLSKLKLESSLPIKYLNSVVIGVGHNDVILSIDSDPTWLGELSLKDPKLTKLAMVDHLLAFDLGFQWVEG